MTALRVERRRCPVSERELTAFGVREKALLWELRGRHCYGSERSTAFLETKKALLYK